MSWLGAIQTRFAHRGELGFVQMLSEFGLGTEVGEAELADCLVIFSEEYGISPGLLRHDDPLQIFTAEPQRTNPFSWLFVRFAYEDRLSELIDHLSLQRKRRGLMEKVALPGTVGGYVHSCLGLKPSVG